MWSLKYALLEKQANTIPPARKYISQRHSIQRHQREFGIRLAGQRKFHHADFLPAGNRRDERLLRYYRCLQLLLLSFRDGQKQVVAESYFNLV